MSSAALTVGVFAVLLAATWVALDAVVLVDFAGACLVAAMAPLQKTAGTTSAMARADFDFTGDSG